MQELYRISIVNTQGGCHYVVGSEELIEEAYNECCEAIGALDGTGPKVIKLEGQSDSADKALHRMIIRVEDIVAVSMVQVC